MEILENQSVELLKTISDTETMQVISEKTARETLSIILDAINSIPMGFIITDLDGFIQFANPSFCSMFNYSKDEIIGKNAADLFATKEVRTLSDVMTIIDINAHEKEEFVVENKQNKCFIVVVSASIVTSNSGQLVGRSTSFIDITKRKEIESDREKLITKLQKALDKIRVLRGLIPICASCKKIRDDKGYWAHIEQYIQDHSDARFTHSICPGCSDKLYGEKDWYKEMKAGR